MAFEQTWRWFGPRDPYSLEEVRQTGATGIVTALHQIPTGEVWPLDEILRRKDMIESAGMTWSVAESIPVHDDIKKRTGRCRTYLENYKTSVANLGKAGIDTVCYHFMPVLDWVRTDLRFLFRDGSVTTRYEADALAAFDLFLLKRPGAENDYPDARRDAACRYFEGLGEAGQGRLARTVLLGFPGSGDAYTLQGLRSALETYESVGDAELRENLSAFLKEVVPVAEESGVLMAIHPDDPPWPLLGLPRVVSNQRDLEHLLGAYDSPSNGMTFCTGSLGASPGNDLAHMADRFAQRIHFIHLRNVTVSRTADFVEDNHLEGDVDMFGVMKTLLLEQRRRLNEGERSGRMPLRPDHGHLMIPDKDRKDVYPGYSLFGRMRGLAELRGLEMGISRSLGF